MFQNMSSVFLFIRKAEHQKSHQIFDSAGSFYCSLSNGIILLVEFIKTFGM